MASLFEQPGSGEEHDIVDEQERALLAEVMQMSMHQDVPDEDELNVHHDDEKQMKEIMKFSELEYAKK